VEAAPHAHAPLRREHEALVALRWLGRAHVDELDLDELDLWARKDALRRGAQVDTRDMAGRAG